MGLLANGIIAPDLNIDVESLSASLYTGGLETQSIVITNLGGSDLYYEIGINAVDTTRTPFTFTKDNYADYNNPDNWDCITESVC